MKTSKSTKAQLNKSKINMKLDNYNVKLTDNQIRIMIVTVIILVIILVFRKQFHNIVERIIVFAILFLLFLIISKNIIVTLVGSAIIFLLVNLIINTRDTIEKFDNLTATTEIASSLPTEKEANQVKDLIKNLGNIPDIQSLISSEPAIDTAVLNNPEFKKSADGIKDFLSQVNGGIELKDDDLEETKDKININVSSYSDDKKPNHLKSAQKEAYELINTVKALQDTIGTLSPVLLEGKKLMGLFESLKL
jgi:hypothetical protein